MPETTTPEIISFQSDMTLLWPCHAGDFLPWFGCRDILSGPAAPGQKEGLAFLPFFPLANGLLTGKYRRGEAAPKGSRGDAGFGPKVFTDENLAKVEKLTAFAEKSGHTLLELAFSWLAAQPMIASVIAGATSPEQVKANATAADWKLTAADLAEISGCLA